MSEPRYPEALKRSLEVPADWSLVAYLCLGYPVAEGLEPESQRVGWQARETLCRQVLKR